MSAFSDNLTKYREKANISRKELAAILGVSVASIGFYETGRNEPDLQKLVTIAAALHVSLDDLLDYHVDDFNKAAALFHEATGKTAVLDGDKVQILNDPVWTRPIRKSSFISIIKESSKNFDKMRTAFMESPIRDGLDLAYRTEYKESPFKGTPLEKVENIFLSKDLHDLMQLWRNAKTKSQKETFMKTLDTMISQQKEKAEYGKTVLSFIHEIKHPERISITDTPKKGPHSKE